MRQIYRACITSPFTVEISMSPIPSLHQLWRLYKALLVQGCEQLDRRGLMLAQDSFYSGARAILKVQA